TLPLLRMLLKGEVTRFTHDGGSRREIFYQKEADRGYESRGLLWSPGFYATNLNSPKGATLIASTEPWGTMLALNPEEALGFYHQRHRRLIHAADPRVHTSPGAD